jgi:hypothetical protein
VKKASEALKQLAPIVREAMYLDRYHDGMAWPNMYEEKYKREEADRIFPAIKDAGLDPQERGFPAGLLE